MKILVADDDAVSRCMIERMLRHSGYQVITARNGVEAMESLAAEDAPRLVLLDWMMPELDGPEVCRAIRAHTGRSYVYITLLTSRDAKEDLIAGLEAGADDYLTKPCNLEELRARLRTGVRILKLEDSLVSARDEMRYEATHDALTRLTNRAAILSRVDLELARISREGSFFAVILCDVDHFKSINDTHGHPVGDEVLRTVAERLRRCVRQTDGVGRYGGEEFLLVLADCKPHDLRSRAEQIREAVSTEPVETSAGPLRVAISVGGLRVDAERKDQLPERLLKDVDAALYHAKKQGRNRTVLVETPVEPITLPLTPQPLLLCS